MGKLGVEASTRLDGLAAMTIPLSAENRNKIKRALNALAGFFLRVKQQVMPLKGCGPWSWRESPSRER